MRLSYVIITRNRCDTVLRNLRQLPTVTPLPFGRWEAIVVDNASSDGTAEAISTQLPWVRLVRCEENQGGAARNAGVAVAGGTSICFLDDDSCPRPGSIEPALQYLDHHSGVGVLGGKVWLPDGRQDGSALPLVPPGCGMIVDRAAFLKVGGFSPEIFMAAEEYDLVFRILRAGYRIERLETLVFDHEKTPASRDQALISRLDLRNNLVIASRHLPRPVRKHFRADWLRRYTALLHAAGYGGSVGPAVADARRIIRRERRHHQQQLSGPMLETLFGFDHQSRQVAQWAQAYRIRHIVIADYTKTLLVTWWACHRIGLSVRAIADNNPGFQGMTYRGQPPVPILSDQDAASLKIDGVVLSNINPARVEARVAALEACYDVPVLAFWPTEAEDDLRSRPSCSQLPEKPGWR